MLISWKVKEDLIVVNVDRIASIVSTDNCLSIYTSTAITQILHRTFETKQEKEDALVDLLLLMNKEGSLKNSWNAVGDLIRNNIKERRNGKS